MTRYIASCSASLLALVSCFHSEAVGDDHAFKRLPKDGGDAVCYDLTADGQIVRLNYSSGEMQTRWKIPLEKSGFQPDAYLWGAVSPDQGSAWLFDQRASDNALCIYFINDEPSGLVDTGVRKEAGADFDFWVLPFDSHTMCFGLGDTLTWISRQGGSFQSRDVPLHIHGWSATSQANGYLYVRSGAYFALDIFKIDLKTCTEAKLSSISPKWPSEKMKRVGIISICESYALFGGISDDSQGCEAVVSLPSGDTRAVCIHELLGPTAASYFRRIDKDTFAADYVQGRKADLLEEGSGYVPNGMILRLTFNVETGRCSGPVTVQYNPRTEHVFCVDGLLRTVPRKRFDYVSMRDLATGIAAKPGRWIPQTWTERNSLIEDLAAKPRPTE